MAKSLLFDYEVKSFSDVVEHLDAIWDQFNQLAKASVCSDPPGTCSTAKAPSTRKRGKKKSAKRSAKR